MPQPPDPAERQRHAPLPLVRSLHSDFPVRVLFSNLSSRTVCLLWINFRGDPVSYGNLEPHTDMRMNTFVGLCLSYSSSCMGGNSGKHLFKVRVETVNALNVVFCYILRVQVVSEISINNGLNKSVQSLFGKRTSGSACLFLVPLAEVRVIYTNRF